MNKTKILKVIKKDYPAEYAIRDFNELKNYADNPKYDVKTLEGYELLKDLFLEVKLETKSNKGKLNFYEFIRDYEKDYKAKPYIARFYKKEYETKLYGTDYEKHIQVLYSLFNMNFCSISMFRPVVMIKIIHHIQTAMKHKKIKHIIDPTAGWGGRALGAIACGIDYTGIDTNKSLLQPYEELFTDFNKNICDTRFIRGDATKINFNRFKYDVIITSPPYFNKELYNGQKIYDTKQEWIDKFYRVVFLNTVKHADKGGIIALSISPELYDMFVKEIFLVPCSDKILYNNLKRNGAARDEFVYMWRTDDIKRAVKGKAATGEKAAAV